MEPAECAVDQWIKVANRFLIVNSPKKLTLFQKPTECLISPSARFSVARS